jgi:hypothetical protein
MKQITFEQLQQQHTANGHRVELLEHLREELDYWQAVSAELRVWLYGPFLGITEAPNAVQILLAAVLKPHSPTAPRRVRRPQVEVHFRLVKDLVNKEEMVRTFNNLPQNIVNHVSLEPDRVAELTLGGSVRTAMTECVAGQT